MIFRRGKQAEMTAEQVDILHRKLTSETDAYAALFRHLQTSNSRVRWLLVLVGLLVVALVASNFLLPPAVVVLQPYKEPIITSQLQPKPQVDAERARSFFYLMLQRRYGWSSLSVHDDMLYLRSFMTEPFADTFRRYTEDLVQVDEVDELGRKKTRSIPRLSMWMGAGVTHRVALESLDNIECKRQQIPEKFESAYQHAWYCYAPGMVQTLPLVPEPDTSPVRKKVEFQGIFPEESYSLSRPMGLGILYLNQEEVS